jgi:SNF2 family DNA or RNA helicase
VIVINYDSARERAFAEFSTAIHWGAVVCDESHRVKHHSSLTSKYVAKLAWVADHRLCLTGTPMGQSPLDLFGQFRFLDAGVFGTSFFHFRSRYAVMANPVIPQMVTGYKNQAELSDRMGWLTYRCRAADVLDLPEKHHIDRRFSLGTKGTAIYEAMEDDLIAEIEGGVVTAANCLVKLIRLQQVTSGFLCPDEGGPIEEFDYAKLEALTELVEDMPTDEPVVVFCRFRHDLARIAQVADDLKRPYAELSGSRRDALDDRGCLAPGVKLAGVQIASGGLGIDLTAARYAIYYNLSYSLTEFDQSIARLHRPGQTRPVHYYHLIAEGTIDEAVYKALNERREIVEAVLEGLKRN